MAQIIINVNNADVPKVLAAFRYNATLPDGSANPETAQVYMKRIIKEWVIRRVEQVDRQALLGTANSTPITPIDVT